MDISYLLLLQNFRNSINDALTPFMEFVSHVAVSWLVIFPAFIYWCVDKRAGLFTIGGLECSRIVNAAVKLTACVYRPWIRDPRVIPAGNAIVEATGYSFPSGHTTMGTALYGGMAAGFWQNKKTRFVSIFCAIMILLTGFSRNYLGVHTPQDVLTGLCLTLLVLFGTAKIFSYCEKHPEKENWFLLGGILLAIAVLIYINVKPYPMDYRDGKLIVDPAKMLKDGFGDSGVLAAFCIARFIEKKWIRFEATGLNFKSAESGVNVKGIIVSLVGVVILYFMSEYFKIPCRKLFGVNWGCLISRGVEVLYMVALWPLVIKLVTKRKEER